MQLCRLSLLLMHIKLYVVVSLPVLFPYIKIMCSCVVHLCYLRTLKYVQLCRLSMQLTYIRITRSCVAYLCRFRTLKLYVMVSLIFVVYLYIIICSFHRLPLLFTFIKIMCSCVAYLCCLRTLKLYVVASLIFIICLHLYYTQLSRLALLLTCIKTTCVFVAYLCYLSLLVVQQLADTLHVTGNLNVYLNVLTQLRKNSLPMLRIYIIYPISYECCQKCLYLPETFLTLLLLTEKVASVRRTQDGKKKIDFQVFRLQSF